MAICKDIQWLLIDLVSKNENVPKYLCLKFAFKMSIDFNIQIILPTFTHSNKIIKIAVAFDTKPYVNCL